MWSRMELKEKAKAVLKVKYLKVLLVCLAVAVLTGQFKTNSRSSSNSSSYSIGNSYENRYDGEHEYYDAFVRGFSEGLGTENNPTSWFKSVFMNDPISGFFGLVFGGIFILFVIVWLLFKLFVSNQIYVGGIKYILETNKHNEVEGVSSLLWTLKTGNFTKVFVTMFLRDFFIGIWLAPSIVIIILGIIFGSFGGIMLGFVLILPCLIPMIIKSYEYYFIPFILADNPSIDKKRAFEITKMLTKGQKMDIVILNISFILWWLPIIFLSRFLPFLVVFLMPYTLSTDAQLYLTLKQTAIDAGVVDSSELEFNNK